VPVVGWSTIKIAEEPPVTIIDALSLNVMLEPAGEALVGMIRTPSALVVPVFDTSPAMSMTPDLTMIAEDVLTVVAATDVPASVVIRAFSPSEIRLADPAPATFGSLVIRTVTLSGGVPVVGPTPAVSGLGSLSSHITVCPAVGRGMSQRAIAGLAHVASNAIADAPAIRPSRIRRANFVREMVMAVCP
jgi:hypothetical protein